MHNRVLEALSNCEYLELFEAKQVQSLLKWKWSQYGAIAHWAQAVVYLGFVMCLSRWLYFVYHGQPDGERVDPQELRSTDGTRQHRSDWRPYLSLWSSSR
jgi:hypothetical protein